MWSRKTGSAGRKDMRKQSQFNEQDEEEEEEFNHATSVTLIRGLGNKLLK